MLNNFKEVIKLANCIIYFDPEGWKVNREILAKRIPENTIKNKSCTAQFFEKRMKVEMYNFNCKNVFNF